MSDIYKSGAGRVCLFTKMEDFCSHPECTIGKTIAQAQPAKAFSRGGMLASLNERATYYEYREKVVMQKQNQQRQTRDDKNR